MITIIVNNVWSRITGLQGITNIDTLDKITSYYVEGYQYTRAFKQGWYDSELGSFRHWDGKKHLLTQKMVFPTGLLERVKDFLTKRKLPFTISDQRATVKGKRKIKIKHYAPRPYQEEALAAAIKSERGIIRVGTGGGKSNRIGTKVLKFDGSICKVEELVPGDFLMGPDSEPRKILSTNKRYGDIVKITPTRGDPWYCNDVHILTLKHTVTNEIIDISIPEYNKQNKKFKHCYKQFSVGVDFVSQTEALPVDPYFLGVWYGDGNKTVVNNRLLNVGITTMDQEVVDAIYNIADSYKKKVRIVKQSGLANRYFISGVVGQKNELSREIIRLLGPNLTVPHRYLTSSRKDRLEFLAGWIDSDGYLHNNCYEIYQKRKDWADSIAFLARSLGFKVTVGEKYNKKYDRIYHRLGISGNVNEIPVRIPRKKALPRMQKKDACKTGFKIEPAGRDYYIGIELDGDGRYLLGDFTVTHNTLISSMISAHYNVPTMIYVVGKSLLYQFHSELEKSLGRKVGMIGDGHCDIKKINICSVWTAAKAFNIKSKVSLDDEDWAPEVLSIGSEQKTLIKKAIENSNLAIFDEAHFLATDTIQSIYKASKKCRYLFGLSGTDWRDDGADLLLESVCGKRIFNMPSSKLIELGFLVQPKITFLDVPPPVAKLPKNYASVYKSYVTENEIRNGMIIDATRKLIEKGRRPLILVKHLTHGRELAKQLSDFPIYFVNGEVDGETREEVKQSFTEGELKCLIASSVYDIGVDIPSLDALILAGGGKSSVRALQRIGRVIRTHPGKSDAIVVDFIDRARYLDKHSAARISIYKTEPTFKVKLPKSFDVSQLEKNKKIVEKISK